MSRESDIKMKVLRGVYEDNAGISRSDQKPRYPGLQHALRWVYRRGKLVSLALISLAVVLGVNFRLTTPVVSEPAVPPPAQTAAASGPAGQASMGEGGLAPRHHVPVLRYASGEIDFDDLASTTGTSLANLFNLEVRTIVIDPGHGGIDPGASGASGLLEKDVALDIARRLRDKLKAAGTYDVILTREDDRKVFLKERVAFARSERADLFISIHINSMPASARSMNFVETYYFGTHTNKQSLALAEKENRDSDYTMGDFRKVLARVGDTMKSQESERLAESVHRHLYDTLSSANPEILDAGSKSGPFMVLLGVEVPSVLVEVSCISNPMEEERLRSTAYRDSVANSLKEGIVTYLDNADYRTTRVKGLALNDQDQ